MRMSDADKVRAKAIAMTGGSVAAIRAATGCSQRVGDTIKHFCAKAFSPRVLTVFKSMHRHNVPVPRIARAFEIDEAIAEEMARIIDGVP